MSLKHVYFDPTGRLLVLFMYSHAIGSVVSYMEIWDEIDLSPHGS